MSNQVKKASFQCIDDLLKRINEKSAEANTEAGSVGGGTSHPVGDVDDSTQDATEGARSAENAADVKNDQGSPAVDSTTPGTPGGQDSVQLNIGTSQKATGEDSAVETSSAKPGKDDGGYAGPSSHPARTDNNELDGNKYSSARHVLESVKIAREAGHTLLAKLAVANEGDADAVKRAGEAMGGGEAAGKLPPETVTDADSDANNPPPGKGEASKSAADEAVIESIAETIKAAHADADLVIEFLQSYAKAAADEPGPPAGDEPEEPSELEGDDDDAPMGDASAEPISAPGPATEGPMGGGGGSPLADMSAEDLILQLLSSPAGEQLLGGAGGGMGGDIGGADAMSGMMGGGAPPAGPAGPAPVGPGGPGGDEAMLAEAMAQEGVDPAELQAKAAAANFKSVTGWQPKTAEEIQRFTHVRNMVRELVGR